MSFKMAYDTIVVGLGVAGCQAAATLAQAGRRVLGLEAQGRIGGRVDTVEFGDGVVELGAEWIHGSINNQVYDLAKSQKVNLINEHLTSKTFRSDGSSEDHELAMEVINLLLFPSEETPNGLCLGEAVVKSAQEYLAANYPQYLKDEEWMEEFLQLLELIINNLNASNSWNDVSGQSDQCFFEGCGHVSWNTQGYKTLFDIILNKHNNGAGHPKLETRLNTEVALIRWPQDPKALVEVTTTNGDTYTADNVIITLSVGVLKECHNSLFRPKLPMEKVDAIKHISMGVMDKIIMSFDQSWWRGDQMFYLFLWRAEDRKKIGRDDYWTTRIFGVSSPKGSRNSVTFWTSGEVAKMVETLPEEDVLQKLMALLRRFLGPTIGNIPDPNAMIRSTWYSNPYTRGSYTYDNVQTPQRPTARSDLGSPLLDAAGNPRVLFAGEATDTDHFSTVQGAMASGYREAKRILSQHSSFSVKSRL